MSNQIALMAERLSIDPQECHDIITKTVMPSKGAVSNEQLTTFIAVANEYQLNPLTKEIYAFPSKGGGIQPIVSIDGWMKIINQNPDFDGIEHEYHEDEKGKLYAVTCSIYRKSTQRPVVVKEYLDECVRTSDAWRQMPKRMLRHKSTIQCARYAFGLSGIIDPSEAESYQQAGVIKDVTPNKHTTLVNEQTTAGVPPDFLSEILAEIVNCESKDELNELYQRGIEVCKESEDRDAAQKIINECKQQGAYLDEH